MPVIDYMFIGFGGWSYESLRIVGEYQFYGFTRVWIAGSFLCSFSFHRSLVHVSDNVTGYYFSCKIVSSIFVSHFFRISFELFLLILWLCMFVSLCVVDSCAFGFVFLSIEKCNNILLGLDSLVYCIELRNFLLELDYSHWMIWKD